ncbi:MAG: hypothetical protein QNJ22_17045 [Desulfosarcinaceae bacterium]|nr:hypothetical protein [Desulfosarcinaceae bacterium]
MRQIHYWILVLACALAFGACSGGPAELLDTAQLEERQFNTAHAVELYEEIVAKHPQSKEAEIARERLQALQSPAQ